MSTQPRLPANFVSVDFETTGLGVDARIIEAALKPVIYDSERKLWAAGVGAHLYVDPGEVEWDPTARVMHTNNGLIAECESRWESPGLSSLAFVDVCFSMSIFNAFRRTEEQGRHVVLIGCNPEFDRRFIARDLPLTHAALRGSTLDLNGLRALRAVSLGVTEESLKCNRGHHRAALDVDDNVTEFLAYVNATDFLPC